MPSPHSIHDYLRMAQPHRRLATDYRHLIRIVRHRFRHARKSKSFFFPFFSFLPRIGIRRSRIHVSGILSPTLGPSSHTASQPTPSASRRDLRRPPNPSPLPTPYLIHRLPTQLDPPTLSTTTTDLHCSPTSRFTSDVPPKFLADSEPYASLPTSTLVHPLTRCRLTRTSTFKSP